MYCMIQNLGSKIFGSFTQSTNLVGSILANACTILNKFCVLTKYDF